MSLKTARHLSIVLDSLAPFSRTRKHGIYCNADVIYCARYLGTLKDIIVKDYSVEYNYADRRRR